MSHQTSRMTASVLGAITLVVALVAPAHEAVASVSAGDGSVDTTTIDPSVLLAADQLMSDQGISLSEAIARVNMQPAVEQLARTLQKTDGSFAGLAINQADAGAVDVYRTDGTDDELIVATANALGIDAPIRTITVAYSLSQLNAYASRIQTQIDTNGLDDTYVVTPRPADSAVQISAPTQLDLAALVKLDWYQADLNTGTPLETSLTNQVQPTTCAFPSCGPPLRGGLRIEDAPGGGAQCTSGATVLGPSGNPWMLTAGHCGPATFWEFNVDGGAWHKIGTMDSSHQIFAGGANGLDAGLIAYPDASTISFWNEPNNYIYQRPFTGGGEVHTEVPTYRITGYSDVVNGEYICHTGEASQTQCGVVTDSDAPDTYAPPYNFTIPHTIQALGKACKGDSGGPTYNHGTIYGIEIAIEPSSDPNCSGGLTHWYSSKIGRIMSKFNVTPATS